MANELDFDKYKSVVDYITSNTGNISASLKALIDNTLATRADSILNVVSSGSAIKTISMGVVSLDLANGIWRGTVPIVLDMNGYGNITITGEGEIPDNALFPSVISASIIEKIAQSFITKTEIASFVMHSYVSAVNSFGVDDVPSLQFFFDNYYSIQDVEIDKKIIITSRDVNDENNVITYAVADILSGAKKSSKTVTSASKLFTSNLIHMDREKTEVKFSPDVLTILGGSTILKASSNKSVVLQNMISQFVMRRDLENSKKISMQEPQGPDMEYVGTSVYLDSVYSPKQKVLQKDVEISRDMVNGLSTGFVERAYSSFGSELEVKCFNDIEIFETLETLLRKNKQEGTNLGPAGESAMGELNNPSGSARNRAVSIKTLYSTISSLLGKQYPSIMIDASEKLALSGQINLIIKDTDLVFGSRPFIVPGENIYSEIATYGYVPTSLGDKDSSDRTVFGSSWGEYLG